MGQDDPVVLAGRTDSELPIAMSWCFCLFKINVRLDCEFGRGPRLQFLDPGLFCRFESGSEISNLQRQTRLVPGYVGTCLLRSGQVCVEVRPIVLVVIFECLDLGFSSTLTFSKMSSLGCHSKLCGWLCSISCGLHPHIPRVPRLCSLRSFEVFGFSPNLGK